MSVATTATADPSVFGTDLLFNRNLVVSAKGDYTEVTGEENLRRAILRRLAVVPGTYKYRPTYGVGLYSFVKKRMTKSLLDQLSHRITDQLSQDRRIDKVLSATVTRETFSDQNGNPVPGLSVVVVVQAKGKQLRFQPFNFARSI